MAEPVVGPKALCVLTVENNHVETNVGGDIRALPSGMCGHDCSP